jgi:hypothetical protein
MNVRGQFHLTKPLVQGCVTVFEIFQQKSAVDPKILCVWGPFDLKRPLDQVILV